MKRKTINDFKIRNYRTLPILEQTKSPFGLFDKSDSKKIYDLIEEAVFALKNANSEKEKARLQRFSYLLCEEIKSNFQELLGDEKTVKKFKEELTKKISKDLKIAKIAGENIFTETDVALAVESAIKSLTDHKFLEKYINILSEKDTDEVIKKFSEELSKDKDFETSIDNLLKNPIKNSELLSNTAKKLVVSTATATKIQNNIIKLTSEIESQRKEKINKKKKTQTSPITPTISHPTESTQKTSLFGNLFKFSALGITAATAAKLTSLFDFNKHKKDQEKKTWSLWSFAKSKISYDLFKISHTVSNSFKTMLGSIWDFGKKTAGGVLKLLKYTTVGILKIIASPFKLLFSGIKKVFWEEDQAVSENIKTMFKRLIFSTGFFYLLGKMFGLLYKLVSIGFNKSKLWVHDIKEKGEHFVEWFEDFRKNWKTIISKKLSAVWNWVKDWNNWKKLGGKIGNSLKDVFSKIFPDDIIGRIKNLKERLNDSWTILKKWGGGAFDFIVKIFKGLSNIISGIKNSKIAKHVFAIAGRAMSGIPSFIGKVITLGISILAAIVPEAFLKLFKNWFGEKEEAFELDEEYRKSLGISKEHVGRNLQSQITEKTSETVVKSINEMITRQMTAGAEIDEYLGSPDKSGSFDYAKNLMVKEGSGKTFRDYYPEIRERWFSFDFLSNDAKAMQDFTNLSTRMHKFFMTSSNEEDENLDLRYLDTQLKFLKTLAHVRADLLMFNGYFMKNLSLDNYQKLLSDKELFINPLYKMVENLNYESMFGNYKSELFRRQLWTLIPGIMDKYGLIDKYKKNLIDLTLRYDTKASKRYIGLFQILMNGKRVSNVRNALFPKAKDAKQQDIYHPTLVALNLFRNLPADLTKTLTSTQSPTVDIPLQLSPTEGFEYLVYALDKTNKEISNLKMHPEEIEPLTWSQLRWKMTDNGTQKDSKIRKNVHESEQYMFNVLWAIFDAAKEAGVLQ